MWGTGFLVKKKILSCAVQIFLICKLNLWSEIGGEYIFFNYKNHLCKGKRRFLNINAVYRTEQDVLVKNWTFWYTNRLVHMILLACKMVKTKPLW